MSHIFKRSAYRAFQFVMKIGNYAVPYRTPDLLEGPGSVLYLPALLKEQGLERVLLVTDRQLFELGLLDPFIEAMEETHISYELFKDLEANPTSRNVEDGVLAYKKACCHAIVAFGGGSPIDCAKAIGARIVRPNKRVVDMQGLFRVLKALPPFYAIPTTAGTGSETTIAAVITDSKSHHKASINDPALIPDMAVLDPELTVGLPAQMTASTAFDAMTHAIEAYTNGSYCTDYERKLAKDAVQLIYENLPRAYEDGQDLKARENLQKAAFYAGRAFTRGTVGYVHALGHTLGGLYGTPHALAMSTILPHVLRQFGPAARDGLAELGEVCGFRGSKAQKAEQLISWIEETKTAMGLPQAFDFIRDEDIPQMIAWALEEANPLYPVPEIWFEEDFLRLIDRLRQTA